MLLQLRICEFFVGEFGEFLILSAIFLSANWANYLFGEFGDFFCFVGELD